jgi:hypothetical protein
MNKIYKTNRIEEKWIQMFCRKAIRREITRNPRPRWENNIKMDFRGIECGVMDWSNLSQDGDLVNMVMPLRVL